LLSEEIGKGGSMPLGGLISDRRERRQELTKKTCFGRGQSSDFMPETKREKTNTFVDVERRGEKGDLALGEKRKEMPEQVGGGRIAFRVGKKKEWPSKVVRGKGESGESSR